VPPEQVGSGVGSAPDRYCRSCRGRLARDNTSAECAACQKKQRDLLLGAPQVPDDFWTTDQMRDALASWHMGRVIAAYRTHPFHGRPLSQEIVGAWAGVSQVQLSRPEHGPAIKHLDRLVAWAETLRIPEHLLWFKLPGRRVDDAAPSPTAIVPNPADLATLLGGLTATRPAVPGQGRTLGISAFEGMTLAQSADLLLKLFLALDDELGGDSLHLPLSRYVARMAVSVEEDVDDGLLGFGHLSQMAGWLALDAHSHGAARRYFTSALYVGHEADEPGLAASALGYMSLQETYRGRLSSALSLAQTAIATGSVGTTPLTRTMLGTRLARAQAGLRERQACLRTLAGARVAFDQAGRQEEPLWISYVDAAELAAQEGACYLDLGMTGESIESLTTAIGLIEARTPRRIRDRVHYLSRLAKCHLAERDLEQACSRATEALKLSQAIDSARVGRRLKEFNDALEPFGEVAPAQQFRELFSTTVGAAKS
jgi:tetratricopeptide (TPR) repeat protein